MREAGGPPASEAPRRYADGEVITRQGATASQPALVDGGLVRLSLVAEDGREVVVAILGPGEVFDECSLVGDGSPVTARAIGATTVRRVAGGDPLAMALARRLLANIRLLEEAMFHDVRSRLLLRLQDLAIRAPGGTRLPLTQEELGRMVGASRETVNRALRDLLAAGELEGARSLLADGTEEGGRRETGRVLRMRTTPEPRGRRRP